MATLQIVERAIAFSLGGLCLITGVALGRSQRVVVNSDGMIIKQQAIAILQNRGDSLIPHSPFPISHFPFPISQIR
ncbi:MAG: hypothetical protein AAFQ80_09015 [Cyanobacteria bacterium J06621_8]